MRRILILMLALSGGLIASAQEVDLYDLNQVHDIKIYFDQKNWHELLDSAKAEGSEDRLLASLVFNNVRYDSVGVRYKGNSSYHNPTRKEARKLPFNIKIDHISKQTLPGDYEKLKLSNVFRDPSFLREALSYHIANKYMPSPRANFVRVFVNDEYLGLYNNVEAIEDCFLEKQFDDDKGVLIKCDPTNYSRTPSDCPSDKRSSLVYQGEDPRCYFKSYELKSKKGWSALIELTHVLKEQPEKIEQYLDVDRALWMHAFNNVLVNLDSYAGLLCHNYYLFNPKGDSTRFIPLVWDMNLSLGGFRYDGEGAEVEERTNEELQNLSLFLHFKNEDRPLISVLLQNSLYRKIYVAHVKTILEENFFNGAYRQLADSLHKRIATFVEQDPKKLYSYGDFKKNMHHTVKAGRVDIIGVTELMEGRINYYRNNRLMQKPGPVLEKPYLRYDSTSVYLSCAASDATGLWISYRTDPQYPFLRLLMHDDGLHHDGGAGDGIYGIVLPCHESLQYYIIAENDAAATLAPARASHEYYSLKDQKSSGSGSEQ